MSFANIDDANYEDLQISIKDLTDASSALKFRALLEDHSVGVQLKEQSLAFTPLSFVNDKVATRTTYTVRLKFNVFSENIESCYTNYANLHNLLYSIKPKFIFTNEQYLPVTQNNTGLISIKFKGLPALYSPTDKIKPFRDPNDVLSIHLTSFSFDINREMGYYNAPFGLHEKYAQNELPLYTNNYIINNGINNSRLVPVGYTLNIEGNVLLPFGDTVRIESSNNVRYTDTGESTVVPREDSGETTYWKAEEVYGEPVVNPTPDQSPTLRPPSIPLYGVESVSGAGPVATAMIEQVAAPSSEETIDPADVDKYINFLVARNNISREEALKRLGQGYDELKKKIDAYKALVRQHPDNFNEDGTSKPDKEAENPSFAGRVFRISRFLLTSLNIFNKNANFVDPTRGP